MQTFESYLDLHFFRNSLAGIALLVLTSIPVTCLGIHGPPPGAFLSSSGPPVFPALQPVEIYSKAFEHSPLFGNAATAKESGAVPLASIAELAKDYRLKGIIIMEKPEALISDARTQKTSEVKAGDHLGLLLVKTITEGSVVLSSGNEEMELKIE